LAWLHVYDLRHFFASQLAKQGANEQQIGRLLCHVGTSVTSRYVHQDIEDLRPFVERLSERFVEAIGLAAAPDGRPDDGDRVIV
jgi:site-specific recombinase XerD